VESDGSPPGVQLQRRARAVVSRARAGRVRGNACELTDGRRGEPGRRRERNWRMSAGGGHRFRRSGFGLVALLLLVFFFRNAVRF
jgi:hypothetical protein